METEFSIVKKGHIIIRILVILILARADHLYIDGKVKESLGIACSLRILGLLGDTAGHHLDHF